MTTRHEHTKKHLRLVFLVNLELIFFTKMILAFARKQEFLEDNVEI